MDLALVTSPSFVVAEARKGRPVSFVTPVPEVEIPDPMTEWRGQAPRTWPLLPPRNVPHVALPGHSRATKNRHTEPEGPHLLSEIS